MKIKFNATGARRKELVNAASEILGCRPVYKGAPSFDFEVGAFTIAKDGTLYFDERTDEATVQRLLEGLHAAGFVSNDPESGMPYDIDEVIDEFRRGPADMYIPELIPHRNPDHDYYAEGPSERDTEESLPEAQAWAERQMRRMRLEDENIPDYSNRGPYGGDYPDEDTLTIEIPLEDFTETALENLNRLIASKETLIKNVLEADALPLEKTETTLKFPWFRSGSEPDEVNAYSLFITALCTTAKAQRRVTARDKPVENEKFAFRVFLIRLGFVGNEYKAARKILLKNLTGNSAFKNGAPPKATEVSTDE